MSEFDCNLDKEVKKYKNLCDSSLREYKDIVRATNSLKKIAKTLEIDMDIFKRRWKFIREPFVQTKKKGKIYFPIC